MILIAVVVLFATGCGKNDDNTEDNGTIGGHSYVDLGLPSGTLWATCNVGAGTPEAYGYYFAWGETEPKTFYDVVSYKYYDYDGRVWTKYTSSDNLDVLEAIDDAAIVNWGSMWHTPTKEQWDELLAFTTHQWTEQNGVGGYVFVSGEASLFLPAAGYRYGDELGDAGSGGSYWSGSLFTDVPNDAWGFYFNSENFGLYNYDCYRYYGFTVRPVCFSSPQ